LHKFWTIFKSTSFFLTTTKRLCSDGVRLYQRTSCDPFLQWLLRDVTETPIADVVLSSNGFGWHHIVTHCYCHHSVAATSHRGHHTSLLLLKAIAATVIQVISPGAVATKGHNIDLRISPTSLTDSETRLYKYFLTSSALSRWLPRIDKTSFWCFRGRHHLLFYAVSVYK
jgi:hypothetical protein